MAASYVPVLASWPRAPERRRLLAVGQQGQLLLEFLDASLGALSLSLGAPLFSLGASSLGSLAGPLLLPAGHVSVSRDWVQAGSVISNATRMFGMGASTHVWYGAGRPFLTMDPSPFVLGCSRHDAT